MNVQPTRRGLLGTFAGLPIAAAFGPGAFPASASAPSPWRTAYSRFEAANGQWDDFTARVYNPAVNEIDAFAPMPDLTWTITARSGQQCLYRFNQAEPDRWDRVHGIVGENGRAKKAAYLAWRGRHQAVCDRIGFDAITEEDERLSDLAAEARKAAAATHVGSIHELVEKASFIREHYDDSIDERLFDEILGDIRRLAGAH